MIQRYRRRQRDRNTKRKAEAIDTDTDEQRQKEEDDVKGRLVEREKKSSCGRHSLSRRFQETLIFDGSATGGRSDERKASLHRGRGIEMLNSFSGYVQRTPFLHLRNK